MAKQLETQEKALPKVDVGGRFLTQYDEALALEILERVAEGETLTSVCLGKPGMPHPSTFRRWMVNNPSLAKAFNNAVTISATSLEEEALDTARAIARAPKDGTHVRAAEVKLGQLRWSAARRDPIKFGDKSQVSIKVPVQIITPIDLNSPANGTNPADIYTLEAKPVTTLEAVAETLPDTQLVPERPTHGNRWKPRLMPPSGVKDQTPFSKAMRGETDERYIVRTEGDRPSRRQGNARPRDAGVSQASAEARGDAPQEGRIGGSEDAKGSG